MNGRQRFVAALEGRRVDRPPMWLMRQAGRYLPEYRAVRQGHTFREMYTTPEVAVEVTLQPIRRFGFDAAILFSDILVVPEAMGVALDFPEGGPVFGRQVRTAADVASLRAIDPTKELGFVRDAIVRLREELGEETALIGFAGAPYTLASYLVEGRGSKDFLETKRLEYREPELLEALLDKLADATAEYLVMQVKAGVDAVQLFDSWGGNLTPESWVKFALPRARRIFDAVRAAGGRSIHFVLGSGGFLERLKAAGSDAIGIDWHLELSDAIARLGADTVVQGNLDPISLQAPPAEVEKRVRKIVEQGRAAKGHVFNVGHGLVPSTPIEGVEALVRAVRAAGEA
jgi:uroporphyrinogen decarboxylase